MKRFSSLLIILLVGMAIWTSPAMGYSHVSSAILGKFVDTADSVSYADISITGGYGSAYLTFKVVISGDYGAAAGAASGYNVMILPNGDVTFSPMYLLQVRSKDYDGIEKNVKYFKTCYWLKKASYRTSYGYRVDAVAYISVERKIEHALWFDSIERVIYNPYADVGGNVYIHM
ncbi:hypothetical protein [Pyrococcus yayanosii]|uniref:Uncharacterized protein n=1 Tax=Pyrococcus yayanosii (strain CH1 / JCM 16557) TaxID=529709 RepID=F8AFB6_PYRYC|nr:hypothetical protein [Pyrococcus yayanosii]AEH24949.1 hypothetical protein PYCH_12770 [Pyrococcus yayanosii CH1]